MAVPAAVTAQPPSLDNAGYGSFYHDNALDSVTGNSLHLGVAVHPGTGRTYVSATGPGGASPHLIYEFNGFGGLLGFFQQPAIHHASAFGIRDMAHDGQSLIGGSELGISVFTPTGLLVNQVQAANGPQSITQPIGGAALAQLGTIRALAYDAQGNGGLGSMFVADFSSSILEIDLSGAILATIPNGGWSAYGLALDPVTGNLWVSATSGGEIGEIDRATGQLTGNTVPMAQDGASAGGLSPASSQDSVHELWPSTFLLAQVAQLAASPDRLAIQRVHLYPGVRGYDEPQLHGAVAGQPLGRTTVTFAPADGLDFVVRPGLVTIPGVPCWTVVNVFFDATRDSYTHMSSFGLNGYFPEWRTLSNISVPSTMTVISAAQLIGSVVTITVPPLVPLVDGNLIRMQTMYTLPQSPFVVAASNELNFVVDGGERGIVISAQGPTSFQSNPATPFWRVSSDTRHSHGDILGIELSFIGATGSAAALRFDLDQAGLGDRFDGGNSSLPGCSGTYRNNTDIDCGLNYQAAGVYTIGLCHLPGESAGAAVTLLPAFVADASKLTFEFTSFLPGKTFEFDCDTDGGQPSGDAHAGMTVQVLTSASGALMATLQVDPAQL